MFYDKVLDDGAKLVPQNSDFKVSLGCQKKVQPLLEFCQDVTKYWNSYEIGSLLIVSDKSYFR